MWHHVTIKQKFYFGSLGAVPNIGFSIVQIIFCMSERQRFWFHSCRLVSLIAQSTIKVKSHQIRLTFDRIIGDRLLLLGWYSIRDINLKNRVICFLNPIFWNNFFGKEGYFYGSTDALISWSSFYYFLPTSKKKKIKTLQRGLELETLDNMKQVSKKWLKAVPCEDFQYISKSRKKVFGGLWCPSWSILCACLKIRTS